MLFRFSLAGAARRWLEKEPPHSILTWEDLVSKFINEFFPPSRTTNLRNEISNFQQRFDESFHEAWDRYKDLLRACPHHGFTELHQLDTFYNALNPADQDSLNSAAGGNLLERSTQDSSGRLAKLIMQYMANGCGETTALAAILNNARYPPPASVKAVEEICVTCGGAHPYYQCLAADGNTFPEYRDNIQGYVAAATGNYNQGNSGYRPPGVANQTRPPGFVQQNGQNNQNRFSQPQGYNRGNNFNQNANYQAPIQQNQSVPLSELEKIKKMNDVNIKAMQAQINNVKNELRNEMQSSIQASMSNQTNELKNMMASFFQMNTASTSAVILKKLPEKLGDPGKFLIPCGFSELKCKALADLGASINLMPLSVWKKLGLPELISTQMTLELANRDICTPKGIARDVFVPVGKFTFPADFVIVDYESDPRVPLILGRPFLRTARALIDVHGEEMILRDGNERLILNMRHDTSSYSNEPHQESINMINVYNVSHDGIFLKIWLNKSLSGNPTPISESMTKSSSSSPTLTSIEESDLIWEEFEAYLATKRLFSKEEFADGLVIFTFYEKDDLPLMPSRPFRNSVFLNHDPIKMFTDEHALDYSSPPLWDDYDDNLFDLETVNDDTYDDPFDFKEEKNKESKLLIDELDPPRSSDFLPFPERDSVFYEDFSEVDALPSTDNEDKVFNPGILIHENLFKVTNLATPEKNVKKATNASLILEDFNHPLYELPFHKEVPGLGALLSFSPENKEKFYNPRILTSKRVHTSLLRELSHQGTKAFKVTKILESPMEIFPCSYQEDIRVLDVPCLHFYPP
ncbi:reverse transcriptase domain-containing protein [Tanacetum coccineum]